MKSFYSNGKLLLTGEYAVLDGALSLAVPTIYGQSLSVKEIDLPQVVWKSRNEKGIIWFEDIFDINEFSTKPESNVSTNPGSVRETLVKILKGARILNPTFLRESSGFEVETQLDFPRDWGLGSSSTLINNIAQWVQVDPYELLWNTFGGSGYDIACAKHDSPILYWLENERPYVEEVRFDPSFKNQLYFVHLNKKQNSREEITNYKRKDFDKTGLVSQVSEITKKMISCNGLTDFEALLTAHEDLLSQTLKISTVKAQYFSDYPGPIKSLGAWGGDFILTTGNGTTPDYFKGKGFQTVIPYSEMVIKAP